MHFFAQLPHLLVSDWVFTQIPLQAVWPRLQNTVLLPPADAVAPEQEPEEQICPELHELPQAPQL
jgi:hypothetical protein